MKEFIKTVDGEIIIVSAFRYSLGRMTYVVGSIVDFIVENWEGFSLKRQKFFQREIREYKEKHGRLGMKMDEEQWQRILDLPLKKK